MGKTLNRSFLTITFLCLQLWGIHVSAVLMESSPNGANMELGNVVYKSNYKPAIEALKKNDFKKVIELAQTYVSSQPTDPQAHLLLVFGYLGNNDNQLLVQHINELRDKLRPVSDAVVYQLGTYFAKRGRYYLAQKYLELDSGQYQPVDTLKLKGDILLKQGRVESAVQTYEELLKLSPDNKEALFALSRLNLVSGKAERASQFSNRLLKLKPNESSVHMLLGAAQLLLGRLAEAENSFTNALRYDPKNEIAWFNIAVIQHLNAEYKKAIESYRKALTKSKSLEARVGLSLAYLSINDVKNAELELQNIRATRKADPIDYLLDASILYSQKHDKRAGAAYHKAGALFIDFQALGFDMRSYMSGNQTRISYLLAFSNFLYRQGYSRAAIGLLDKNNELLQQSVFLQLTYARCMVKIGKNDIVSRLYIKINERYKKLVTPILEKADLNYRMGRKSEALAGYKAALNIQPELVSVRYRLGNLYNDVNQPENALIEYKHILKKHNAFPKVLNQLAATMAEKMREPEEALGYAEKALKLEPTNLNIKYTLALIYYDMGQYKQASSIYSDIAAQPWDDPVFYFRAGNALLRVNDKKKAALLLEKSLNFGIYFSKRPTAERQLEELTNKPLP